MNAFEDNYEAKNRSEYINEFKELFTNSFRRQTIRLLLENQEAEFTLLDIAEHLSSTDDIEEKLKIHTELYHRHLGKLELVGVDIEETREPGENRYLVEYDFSEDQRQVLRNELENVERI